MDLDQSPLPSAPLVKEWETTFRIERSTASARPASITQEVEGWLLRSTPDVGWRCVNSVLPPLSDKEKLLRPDYFHHFAENFYEGFEKPIVYRLPRIPETRTLSRYLDNRGYRASELIDVMIAPVERILRAANARTGLITTMSDKPTDEWIAQWAGGDDIAEANLVAQRILARSPQRSGYALVREADHPVAVSAVFAARDWAGFFSLAVEPRARRTGIGRHLIYEHARWCAAHDVRWIYLEVVQSNAASLAMCSKAGFTRSYSYCYRYELS